MPLQPLQDEPITDRIILGLSTQSITSNVTSWWLNVCELVLFGLVCWSLTSLCHSNGHIETMPAREINPFTALTRIRSQFLRTQ